MSEAQPERDETGLKGDGDVEIEGVTETTVHTKDEANHDTSSEDSPGSDDEETTGVDKGKGKADSEGGKEDDDDDDDEEDEEEDDDEEEEDDDDEDEDEEDEEPRLKYARLTQNLGGVYRNGDATSAFLVAGDKMIVGTHNGNIHVFQLPTFQPLRVYHAHSASVTAISISPFTPAMTSLKTEQINKIVAESAGGTSSRPGSRHQSELTSPTASPRKANRPQGREPTPILNVPSNNIYIATASTDGNVCIQSLIDIKDVQLRNFGRPVQTVALSPEYRQDRTYLSGGLAGNLILTVGGQAGRSTSTTVGTAAAAASGWLGTMGLGTNTGKDTILHSGEGTISNIQWSWSGKYVAWLNEHGIKIMRTKLLLESADAESAWKRIGHIDRPQTEEWDTMASVWKGRAHWIDEANVEPDEKDDDEAAANTTDKTTGTSSPAAEKLKQAQTRDNKAIERLLVGWGSTIWIINVHPGGVGVGKHAGERSVGRAEIVKILRMDCIISGLSLYTQNLLLVLAYCLPDEDDEKEEDAKQAAARGHRATGSMASTSSEPSGGIRRRQNNQPPELRLIDLTSQVEIDKDGLSVSRFERLSAGDYHLGILPSQTAAAAVSSKGALEAIAGLGADMWNAAINPKSLFSSGQSIRSKSSTEGGGGTLNSATGTLRAGRQLGLPTGSVHPSLSTMGIKIFIHSPYDCILSTKRDLSDHLSWLLEHQEYQKAWELVDEHPESVPTADLGGVTASDTGSLRSSSNPSQADDFFAGGGSDAAIAVADQIDAISRAANAPAEREKRRIGELWIKEIVDTEQDWVRAGQVAGKVLKTADRWEKWIWAFASADKFDEIVNYIPAEPLNPPIPQTIYEIVLGHYLKADKPRFRELLLERWPTELFDISTVVTALENQLNYRDVREDSVEGGERGRDWRIVMESLARMHEANGRYREALKSYIRLQDADNAFRLIRDNHLADAVIDDITRFITLRVPTGKDHTLSVAELEEATAEAITLLVDEAQHGLVQASSVVSQLQADDLNLYIFFYFRGLWRGGAGVGVDGLAVADSSVADLREHHGDSHDRLVAESRAQLDGFADLAVHLFAQHDRTLLKEFLKSSTSYSFEKAAAECERYTYIDELVFLYSKTGQMKRALYLIIDRLGDVGQAISFAKEQDDPDLWEDLLEYSMDKPRFIRGLLEQVGTSIDPITLVRRIPEGLEIDGLREGLKHIMKEHEIQHSISLGAARVLRSEVAVAQNLLRSGQRKGIKFNVVPADAAVDASKNKDAKDANEKADHAELEPGHCASCREAFTEWDADMLVGFACGHVFHLEHLLGLQPGEAVDLGFGVDSEVLSSGRHILGTKITHARLLRDRVHGCTVCG